MYQQQRIITSDYQIVDEDEYTVLLVYASVANINIFLPYATNFDKVIILKADTSLNEVFVHLKGNDTFQGSKAAYRLSRPYQLVEFTTDNESAWYAVSTYSSGSAAVGGSGGVSLHADLDGLLANDHPQYLHVSGSNPIASNLNMRGFSIFDVLNINDVNILSITSSIDGHILDTNNPHATTFSNLDPGTLAELNSIITDANLDDSGSARTPTLHSASHLSGGSDPISIQQLEARGVTEGHLFAAGPNGNIITFPSSAFAQNDHGSLNGLGDLDHPQYETTASFRPYSASINVFTASVLSFSSSYSTRISSLENQSGSLTASIDILQKASSSFRADIGDLQNVSASFSSRVTSLESASGTFVTQFTELYAASASFDNVSASYATFSASFVGYSASWSSISGGGGSTDISALNSHSASVQSFTASVQNFTASIQSQTASVQTFSASMLAASGAFAQISSSYKSFSASHATNHLSGGIDAINAQDLGANGLGANRLLITNPNGGWTTVPSSSVGAGGGATDITALNEHSASINQFTSSIQAQTASIQVFTASMLAASSSFESRQALQTASITRLDNSSASYAAFSASFVGYSASWSSDIVSLLSFSQSVKSFSSSIQSQTASIQSFSASMLAASGAFATISASYKTMSASYVLSSASWSTRIASMTSSVVRLDAASGAYSQISSSYKTFSASFVNYSSSWSGASRSYHAFSASHASRHLSGGADPIDVQSLRGNGLVVNRLLITDGNGGWTTVASQSVGGAGGSTDISALNAFSASIQSQTASIQVFSASMLAASGAFATISSSYKGFSASFVNYSASWTAGLGGGGGGGPTILFSDTTISQSIATLPASPSQGDRRIIADSGFNADTNAIIITGSHNILTERNDHILTNGESKTLLFDGTRWIVENRSTGVPSWHGIYDTDTANCYSGSTGLLSGTVSGSFWVEALIISPSNLVDSHTIFSNFGSNSGWHLQISFGNASFATWDSSDSFRDAFYSLASRDRDSKFTHLIGKVAHFGTFYEYQIFVNGSLAFGGDTFASSTTFKPSDASNRVFVGANAGGDGFNEGIVLGGSYSDNSNITTAQVFQRYKEITQAGRLIAGTMNPDHRYDARDVIDAGASWVDVGASASATYNLTRTGTPSYRRGFYR